MKIVGGIVGALTGFLTFYGIVLSPNDSLVGAICLIGALAGVTTLIICRKDF